MAASLALALLPDEQARLGRSPYVNAEAYDAYLKGASHYYRLTRADLDTAQQHFEFALEKDPDFALGYLGLARVWAGRGQMNFVPSTEAIPKGKAAVLRALQLDETLPEAHSTLASLRTWGDWDWTGAESAFERALELDPGRAGTHAPYSHFLMITGRPEAAMAHIDRALELDPFNAFFRAFYGVDLMLVRRYDDAVAAFRDALVTSPGLPFAWHSLSVTLELAGRLDEALAARTAYLRATANKDGEAALTAGYAAGGYEEAIRRLAATSAARALVTGSGNLNVAELYLRAGNEASTFEWLERAFQARDQGLPYLAVLPMYDSLRGHPHFQDMLRRMNLAR